MTLPNKTFSRNPTHINVLPKGCNVHRYQIMDVLNADSCSIVYRCIYHALKRQYLIKEYFPFQWVYRNDDGLTVQVDPQAQIEYRWGIERHLNEAMILTKINHPGILRILDYFEANGTAYIVMEDKEGEQLSQVLQQDKILSEPRIFRLIEDVLSALEATHTSGYLYRDLKPDTLYCSLDNQTILFNFNAALALQRHHKHVTAFFSPGYSPIECYLTDGRRYGPWSDVYAFGAMLYHCVTGAAPIESPARVFDDPLRPAEVVAIGCYTPVLLRWIDQSMTVRPEQRFQSIAEMRAAINFV